jgi:phosphoribosylcarboxyaminoimidazole (NCAIR) mutase
LAAAILALSDEGVAGRLDAFRNKQNQAIAEVPAK